MKYAAQTEKGGMTVADARGIIGLAFIAGCTNVLGLDRDYHLLEAGSGGKAMSTDVSSSASSTTASSSSGGAGPPSCAGLAETCGAGESCCAARALPGGTFARGYDGASYTDTSHPATVSAFALDRFEVTVGRFRRFVESYPQSRPGPGAGKHPLVPSSGWRPGWDGELPADKAALIAELSCDTADWTWTDSPGPNEDKPMNCASWYEAFAFCAWDGGRLPTEAEWNYAAAGGDEQRPYPWGAPIDPTYSVYDCTADGSAAQDCTSADMLAVGSRSPKGDGKWGHADLAGSLWEWTLDADGAYPDPCDDCASLGGFDAPPRVYRGGGWFSPDYNVLASKRSAIAPGSHVNRIGIRCARDP